MVAAGLHRAEEHAALPVVKAVELRVAAVVKQHEDFPQDSLPQEDVDPGVQDLVPRGHSYQCQQMETRGLSIGADTENDDMDLGIRIKEKQSNADYLTTITKTTIVKEDMNENLKKNQGKILNIKL